MEINSSLNKSLISEYPESLIESSSQQLRPVLANYSSRKSKQLGIPINTYSDSSIVTDSDASLDIYADTRVLPSQVKEICRRRKKTSRSRSESDLTSSSDTIYANSHYSRPEILITANNNVTTISITTDDEYTEYGGTTGMITKPVQLTLKHMVNQHRIYDIPFVSRIDNKMRNSGGGIGVAVNDYHMDHSQIARSVYIPIQPENLSVDTLQSRNQSQSQLQSQRQNHFQEIDIHSDSNSSTNEDEYEADVDTIRSQPSPRSKNHNTPSSQSVFTVFHQKKKPKRNHRVSAADLDIVDHTDEFRRARRERIQSDRMDRHRFYCLCGCCRCLGNSFWFIMRVIWFLIYNFIVSFFKLFYCLMCAPCRICSCITKTICYLTVATMCVVAVIVWLTLKS